MKDPATISPREAEKIGELLVEHHETLGISFQRIAEIVEHRLSPAFGQPPDLPLMYKIAEAERANCAEDVLARPGNRDEGEFIYRCQLRAGGPWYFRVAVKDGESEYKPKAFRDRGDGKAYQRAKAYRDKILEALGSIRP